MNAGEVQTSITNPHFLAESEKLVTVLKKYKPSKLADLMKINPKLAQLNFERYQEWQLPFSPENAKIALLSFQGDVFRGIDAASFQNEEFDFAQKHLLILSGLYGILRPLDLIQAYRLEMGTRLKIGRNNTLYEFWKNKIADFTLEQLKQQKESVIINLASKEYFKAIEPGLGSSQIITPIFKENRDGTFKFIHTLGKRARGLMCRFIIQNKITDIEKIKLFDSEGYYYNDKLSSTSEWVFTR